MTRQNKYNVSEKSDRTLNGIVFDSKAELHRFTELKILEKHGVVYNLCHCNLNSCYSKRLLTMQQRNTGRFIT